MIILIILIFSIFLILIRVLKTILFNGMHMFYLIKCYIHFTQMNSYVYLLILDILSYYCFKGEQSLLKL